MSNDVIGNWVEKAKQAADAPATAASGVKVIKRAPQSRGNVIMEIAEMIRPMIAKFFDGQRDENGMIVQPARIRAVALNMAQGIVIEQEKQSAA